jgi:glycogen operon protein
MIPKSSCCAASSARTSSPACCSHSNNAFCQDNDVGWVKWDGLWCDEDDLTAFLGHLIELRRRFPQLRARRWIEGPRPDGSFGLLWLRPDADEMKEADWEFPEGRFLAYVLGPLEQGQRPIFIVLNAAPEEIPVQAGRRWPNTRASDRC